MLEVVHTTFDVRCDSHGPIWTLTPLTKAGLLWLVGNLERDPPRWRSAFVVERARINGLVTRMMDDGIAVH